VHEIVVRRDADHISMMIHWQGGDHTAIEFATNKTGEHRWTASEDVVALIRAYSTPFRSLIPRQIDHRFHANSIADSTAIRSAIPRQIDRLTA
jgi:hypothetical protein